MTTLHSISKKNHKTPKKILESLEKYVLNF